MATSFILSYFIVSNLDCNKGKPVVLQFFVMKQKHWSNNIAYRLIPLLKLRYMNCLNLAIRYPHTYIIGFLFANDLVMKTTIGMCLQPTCISIFTQVFWIDDVIPSTFVNASITLRVIISM